MGRVASSSLYEVIGPSPFALQHSRAAVKSLGAISKGWASATIQARRWYASMLAPSANLCDSQYPAPTAFDRRTGN